MADDDDALEAGHGRAAEAFADDDGTASDRGDQHLAQEAELAVPDDGGGGEHGGEHDRHGQDAGVEERAQVEAAGAARGESGQAAAEHEQKQKRLHQRGRDPQAVVEEADQLALPDDLDGAQFAAATLRLGTRMLATGVDVLRSSAGSSKHLHRSRPRWPAVASASRIVLPV